MRDCTQQRHACRWRLSSRGIEGAANHAKLEAEDVATGPSRQEDSNVAGHLLQSSVQPVWALGSWLSTGDAVTRAQGDCQLEPYCQTAAQKASTTAQAAILAIIGDTPLCSRARRRERRPPRRPRHEKRVRQMRSLVTPFEAAGCRTKLKALFATGTPAKNPGFPVANAACRGAGRWVRGAQPLRGR